MAVRPLALGLALLLAAPLAKATMVLTKAPPRGFNTFDSYPGLDHTDVLTLADQISTQLASHGYEYLVLDGGWSSGKECKVLPNGTKTAGECFNKNGIPIADPLRFPDMPGLVKAVNAKGLKLGLWVIRGVYQDAVDAKYKIQGTDFTVDQFVDTEPVGGGPNGSCLWAKNCLGINMSHPAAQPFYDSHVQVLADYGIDFIKADCMMCGPCYVDEIMAFSAAVRKNSRPIVLSYSPGGGNSVRAGRWVAGQTTSPDGHVGVTGPSTLPLGTMYRIVTDFHGGWYGWGGLQQSLMIQGNFSAAGLNGANGTWPDPDMIPIGSKWWGRSTENDDRGQTIMSSFIISQAPLMVAGKMPLDEKSMQYLANPLALTIHAESGKPHTIDYQGNCTESHGSIPRDGPFPTNPCVMLWAKGDANVDKTMEMVLINLGENTTTVSPKDHHLLARLGAWTGVDVWTGKAVQMSGTFTLRPHASLLMQFTKATI